MTDKKPRTRSGGEVVMLLLALGFIAFLVLLLPPQALAQSPWESSAQKLQTAFTGPIAKALSLVAIVVGGLMFAYGEGQGKKVVAGIVFGVGMAVGAMNFLAWLF
jgi:type IV secretion system protein TrbC